MKKISLVCVILLSTAACTRTTYYKSTERPCAVVDQTYVHKYGFEVEPQEWESRGEHGQKISVLNTGVTATQNYSYGKLDGECTYSFPYSSSIERVQSYSKDELVADEIRYMSNTPKRRTEMLSNGTKRMTQWYENSVPQMVENFSQGKLEKGEYYTISNQLESRVDNGSGTRTNRDTYGQLVSKDTIENGEMIERVTYWANGTPKEMVPYKNEIVHGLRRSFFVGGEPNEVESWQNGVQSGVSITYRNGEKYAEIPYVNGVKSGVEKRYRDGTQLFEEITWLDGNEINATFTRTR